LCEQEVTDPVSGLDPDTGSSLDPWVWIRESRPGSRKAKIAFRKYKNVKLSYFENLIFSLEGWRLLLASFKSFLNCKKNIYRCTVNFSQFLLPLYLYFVTVPARLVLSS
jgi:hypothetical protein